MVNCKPTLSCTILDRLEVLPSGLQVRFETVTSHIVAPATIFSPLSLKLGPINGHGNFLVLSAQRQNPLETQLISPKDPFSPFGDDFSPS